MAVISFPTSIGGVHIPSMSKAGGPLSALFGDVFGLDVLKYPRDLGSSTRAHYVTFRIYDIKPFSLEEGGGFGLNDIKNFFSGEGSIGDRIGKFSVDEIKDSDGNVITEGVAGTGLVGQGESWAKGFSKNLNLSSLSAPLSQQRKEISLYIPDSVTFDYSATYGEIVLNPLAEGNALTNLPGISGMAAKAVASVGSNEVTKLFLKAQGLAINPNQQVMFDSISLREFSFEFIFMPKSKQETDDVKDIIKAFKMFSRPRTVEGTYGMIFVPPSIFKIDFRFLNGRNQYVNKVADSVCTNVEVDYTPNGWSTHQDGSPVNIKMKLQFKELSLIDRDGVTSVDKEY
jgi:hypothetical protein